MKDPHATKPGFTIIEMIVSIGIFTVVAVAAVAALTSVIEANRRTQSLTESNNNLNFVLQSMVREIRNGFNYGCGVSDPFNAEDCPSGSSAFGFVNSARDGVGFKLNNGRIEDENGDPITPEQVTVEHLEFRVDGATNSNKQARVEISIQIEAGTDDAKQKLNLQTTATQRLLYTQN
jgi:prepilin-type N-terminal cleavage/methylation domain-containing protein